MLAVTPTLTRHDTHLEVFLLDLGDGENRFTPDWVAAVSAHLDDVAAAPEPRALVTTATGKTWSQGLDLEWVSAHPDELMTYVASVHGLFAQVLDLPVPTVAAIQGHAYAAGAMLALAHDQRVMRSDRGYFCLPEVDIRIPFTAGMTALISAKLAQPTLHEVMTTGARYGGADAAAKGIVSAAVDEDALLDDAVARALALAGKHGDTLGTIKGELYKGALEVLRTPAEVEQPPA
jgi:enoyl-CoA hydratase/carnithine racemase